VFQATRKPDWQTATPELPAKVTMHRDRLDELKLLFASKSSCAALSCRKSS
jgi:hypothetical protein